MDDKALETLCKACPQLETLNVAGCVQLTDGAMKIICEPLRPLSAELPPRS